MDNETSMGGDEGSPMSFLMDNLVPVMVTAGCVTAGLAGTLFAVKSESKKR